MRDALYVLAVALVLCAAGVVAYGQDYPFTTAYGQSTAPNFDQLTIEDGEIQNTATVIYGNDDGQSSDAGEFTLTAPNGITVQAIIAINVDGEGRERITVLTPDEYVAWPVEADVSDGDEVKIQIIRPMS